MYKSYVLSANFGVYYELVNCKCIVSVSMRCKQKLTVFSDFPSRFRKYRTYPLCVRDGDFYDLLLSTYWRFVHFYYSRNAKVSYMLIALVQISTTFFDHTFIRIWIQTAYLIIKYYTFHIANKINVTELVLT